MPVRGATRCLLLSAVFLSATGCVRRDGRNSGCMWPGEPGSTRPQSADHLRADVEFAEELAIEYMDAHAGPRDKQAAARAKNKCMGMLLEAIGKEHGITAKEAFTYFGRRNLAADIAMNLPFFLLYALAVHFAVRKLPRRSIALYALVFAVVGLFAGGFWSSTAESIRIGTSHLSNRALRLPWEQHQAAIFAFLLAIFGVIAAVRTRRLAPE